MKYITFNSACSYAGAANMLMQFGVDTDDRTIALDMGLPFLFSRDEDGYAAGPMLQSARWFNLYLHPMGFHMEEEQIPANQVPDYIKRERTAMLGIRMEQGGKHALTYVGYSKHGLRFLNNKWQQEDAEDALVLTEQELIGRIDDPCMVAVLRKITPAKVDIAAEMAQSINILDENLLEIEKTAAIAQPVSALRRQLTPLFRPLLLDGITMLDLLGETDLHRKFTAIQQSFLAALRRDDPQLLLCEHISLENLRSAVTEYKHLILAELNRRKCEAYTV